MRIYYRPPVVTKDNQIVIEQVTEGNADALPNGIQRKEIRIVAELYPSLELLVETVKRAEANYSDVRKQGNKTVFQLEAEKQALHELKIMIDKKFAQGADTQVAPAAKKSPLKAVKADKPVVTAPVRKATPAAKKTTARKPAAKKTTTARKTAAKKTTTRKTAAKKTTTARKPAAKKATTARKTTSTRKKTTTTKKK